jgi:hypothetical protein
MIVVISRKLRVPKGRNKSIVAIPFVGIAAEPPIYVASRRFEKARGFRNGIKARP